MSKFKLKPQAYELDAYRAPGHWFFCRRIELPEDLAPGEEAGYVLLELEGMSPFPLEHLYYGFVLDGNRSHAFVFAAYRRRFEGTGVSGWQSLDAVVPDFLVALRSAAADHSPLVALTEKSVVGFAFDEQSELPCGFAAASRSAYASEEDAAPAPEVLVESFLASRLNRLGIRKARIWNATTDSKWVGPTARFTAEDLAGGRVAEVSFERDEMWDVDLRDSEMLDRAKRMERQNALLWRVVIGLAAAIGLMLLAELYWVGSSIYLSQRLEWNEERVDQVQNIDRMQSTNNTLRRFQDSDLAPFQIIDELWPYTQWPKVVFRRFETDGPDTLIIDARSANQKEMTDFKRRLESFSKVDSVELSNQVANPQGTTFKTTIRFVPGAFSNAREVASNE